jgi:hypothetical protein
MLEIAPIPLAQIRAGVDGRQYEISAEAGSITARLQEIEPTLRIVFNETGGFFAVQQVVDAGGHSTPVETDTTQRKCVLRVPADGWDERVVREIEMRAHELRHGISANARLEAEDDRRHRDADEAFHQDVGERAERLFHGFQRGLLNMNPRAYFSRGLPD